KGIFNPAAKPDLAVVSDNTIYFTNGMENRVYLVQGGIRSDYVADNTPSQTQEGADKDFYPLRYPASVTTDPSGLSVFFCDRDNNKIKFVSVATNKIYTKVGSATVIPFTDGMDPLSMTPVLPILSEFDRVYGNFLLREKDFQGIRILRPNNRVYNFAGTGTAGFFGDEGPATAAQLNDPLSVAVDSRGNVYIADTGNHAIRMVIGGALP
ncbi:MAG: NHL repeat-containing protein, partial [Deltaproteobacteria bacterium CSP1-8]